SPTLRRSSRSPCLCCCRGSLAPTMARRWPGFGQFRSRRIRMAPTRRSLFVRLLVLAGLATVSALLLLRGQQRAPAAQAAGYLVNSFLDEALATAGSTVCLSTGGHCTLRAAVQAANNSLGADTITLPAGVYNLTIAGAEEFGAAGDLDVTDPLTI